MKEKLSTASVNVQGSGWGWLAYNKANDRLQIATCANQAIEKFLKLLLVH
jgi:Fe-Mn family superoxide dismutase